MLDRLRVTIHMDTQFSNIVYLKRLSFLHGSMLAPLSKKSLDYIQISLFLGSLFCAFGQYTTLS